MLSPRLKDDGAGMIKQEPEMCNLSCVVMEVQEEIPSEEETVIWLICRGEAHFRFLHSAKRHVSKSAQ